MRYFYLFLLAITTLTACKRQGNPQPVEDAPNSNITRIRYYFVDKTYFEAIYNYTPQGLLSSISFRDSIDGVASTDKQYYTGLRLDSSISVDKDNKAFNKNLYIYQGNKLSNIKHYEFNPANNRMELYYDRTVTYNGSVLYKTSDANTYTDHDTYTIYTYANGNVSEINIYKTSSNELLEHTIYEYDDKPNPYYNRPYTNRYNIINNKNNVTFERLVYGKNRQPGQVRYQYTYNSQGYPLIQYIQSTGTKLIAEQEFFYNK